MVEVGVESARRMAMRRQGPCAFAVGLAQVPASRWATRASVYRALVRAQAMIDSDLGRRLTLAEISREVGLSPFHLQRVFRQTFGETPSQYRSRRRLETAQRLLATTEMPVSEVCAASGFSSLGSFSGGFKARYGLTPSEFREKGSRGGGSRR
ncbi:helix-turn-helix transcriptional regulator [Fimbriimonadia bacterium ATM]|nr:MAG: AraC family transcriptional regulator [Armatimonadota bacterium]MBC6969521.1 AraC family transcriptional regulator [Armatimonadota bacterium]MCE7899141.1 AraC family transcriptional regulator [Armatimonadetes bacterium ATM1]MDL1929448.1 helix-turn-helix transcriptional regulator [Fimbriimonadia bacterium ATM]RIJ97209.1 MAG: AraC family transcriptional regulator [Armatimonadota bacterium]